MRIAYNLTKLHQSAGGSSWVTEYTYDKDNRPVTVKVNGKTITDSYNAAGTRSSRVYGFATPYTVSFGYLAGANESKTTMLQSYKNGSDAAYTYTYDNNGNVTAISQGAKSAAYTYDALNQLTRVNDGFTNKTTTYTYDEQGIRSGKTINGVTTSFSYNGSLLMAQVAPEKSLLFSYDANGQAISVNYNGTEYYYLRNGQNDIVGLMDESGVRVVEYIYDAWGKLISTTGTLATTLGADNPFRYRGYYYDTETGLYYLTTRYYDPEVCRFISADVYMSTGQGVLGGNMWAYCLNNPVAMVDSNGEFALAGALLAGVASIVVGGLFGGLGALASGDLFAAGFVSGSITAILTVAAITAVIASAGTAGVAAATIVAAGAAGGVVDSAAGYGAECAITGKEFEAGEAIKHALISGTTGALSGGFSAIVSSAGSGLVNVVTDVAGSYIAALHTEAIGLAASLTISAVEKKFSNKSTTRKTHLKSSGARSTITRRINHRSMMCAY